MATEWLATLPAPQAKGLKITQQPLSNQIEFDAGNKRQMNHASTSAYLIDCQLLLTKAQLDSFNAWFKATLDFGTAWITATWLEVIGLDLHYCRFFAVPNYQKQGGMFLVSCQFYAVYHVTAYIGDENGFYLGDENNNYVGG